MFNFDGPNGVATKPAYGAAGTETWFTGGDPSASPPVPASNPGQDWFNMVQGELGAVVAGAGLARSKASDAQVVAAIKSLGQLQAGNYAADSGAANAMAVTLAPVPASLSALTGVPIRIKKIASANTGAVTLAVNGLGAAALTWPDGAAVAAGELPASCFISVRGTGSAFVLTSGGQRPVQPTDTTQSLGTSGWVKLPNGLVQQWSSATFPDFAGNYSMSLSFPVSFGTAVYQVLITAQLDNGFQVSAMVQGSSVNLSGFSASIAEFSAVVQVNGRVNFLALGK